jgi:hypothetical protein
MLIYFQIHPVVVYHITIDILIRRTACARVHFGGCSSKTNVHSETGQMAACCQNLALGALSSRSALSLLVGALFKKFGLFLIRVVCTTFNHNEFY